LCRQKAQCREFSPANRHKKRKKTHRANNESHFLPFFATLKCIKKGCTKKILVYFNTATVRDILNDEEPHEKRSERDRGGRI
jgi:hypothetical protein